jgi:hypothetical protein
MTTKKLMIADCLNAVELGTPGPEGVIWWASLPTLVDSRVARFFFI